MAAISAKALFHFTDKKENLFNIISTGFRPSYSMEFGDETGGRINPAEIPMCCFCDLPLSSILSHMNGHEWPFEGELKKAKAYGNYGLGMTKKWGQKKGLNPVLYINYNEEGSYLKSIFSAMNNMLLHHRNNSHKMDSYRQEMARNQISSVRFYPQVVQDWMAIFLGLENVMRDIQNCFSYYKPYESSTSGQTFYNEREWRYVVPHNVESSKQVPVIFPKEYPELLKRKPEFQKLIIEHHMLTFNPEDIKYIIINDDSEVDELIAHMRLSPEIYTDIKINKLLTRIITNEQLRDDT